MNLYFSPLSCSLATRIALYEAQAPAEFTQVDLKAKRLPDGSDFRAINPMGMVPVLRDAAGHLLTENVAILTWVADQYPEACLAPASGPERAHLLQWLGFTNSELHKAVFVPLLDPKAPDAVKAYSREKAALRLDLLQQHLDGREFLLDGFTVADAYLFAILNWAKHCDVDLAQWPAVSAYVSRLLSRPSVARALAEELRLYRAEVAREAERTAGSKAA